MSQLLRAVWYTFKGKSKGKYMEGHMKKIVAIMLIGVMALAFYACGSKEDKNTPTDENQAYLDSLEKGK